MMWGDESPVVLEDADPLGSRARIRRELVDLRRHGLTPRHWEIAHWPIRDRLGWWPEYYVARDLAPTFFRGMDRA